jgi:hypothetical protein
LPLTKYPENRRRKNESAAGRVSGLPPICV